MTPREVAISAPLLRHLLSERQAALMAGCVTTVYSLLTTYYLLLTTHHILLTTCYYSLRQGGAPCSRAVGMGARRAGPPKSSTVICT